MNILITGADGFIGSRIYRYFHSRYQNVTGTAYYTRPVDGMRYLDLRDESGYSSISDWSYDLCIHAAGTVDQSLAPGTIMEINAEGTKRLLDQLRRSGCSHFIQLSSITVYGKRVVGTDRSEKTKRKTTGLATIPYGRAKAKAEEYIEASGIPYTILRLPPVLGEKDTALTPAILKRLEQDDLFSCSDDSKPVSILHVDALPEYIERLLETGPQNDAFNIASHHFCWDEFISLYTEAWDCLKGTGKPVVRKKRKLSFVFKLRDKDYLLSAMFSAFGSHFPTDKLEKIISLETDVRCEDAVHAAINGCS